VILWSKNEIEYVVNTVLRDKEYGMWMIEQALQKAWDHELKIDWHNTSAGILSKWKER
jgi:hypothetical protein